MSNLSDNVKSSLQSGAHKTMRFVKRLLIVLVILTLLASVAYYFISGMTFSEGNRAGYLVKISKKGMVFKTYEGQLNLAGLGMSGLADMSSENVWAFTAANEATYLELQKYEGKKVTLHYHERYRSFPWQGDTKYFVDKVEPIE